MNQQDVQIIVPRGMFGASPDETTLDSAMRLIALANSKQTDEERLWQPDEKYGADIETDVFLMRPDYQDAKCTCGFAEIAEKWGQNHRHTAECYQTEMRQLLASWPYAKELKRLSKAAACDVRKETTEEVWPGLQMRVVQTSRSHKAEAAHNQWCALFDKQGRYETSVYRRLCKKHGKDPEWGAAVHCTCYLEDATNKFFAENNHDARCPIVLPNFWYKPTDFQVRWYKYIGREMETNRELQDGELATILEACGVEDNNK